MTTKKLIDKLSVEDMDKIDRARRLGRERIDVQIWNDKTQKYDTIWVNVNDFE